MTGLSREIEFKFGIDDPHAFTKLTRALDLPASVLENSVIQTNHFFDSDKLCLHAANLAIRLREQQSGFFLAVKGKQKARSQDRQSLTERIEVEMEIPQETAMKLLSGELAPDQAIAGMLPQVETVMAMITDACRSSPLLLVGSFTNKRIKLPPCSLEVRNEETVIEFELDESSYPNGRVDHEIEVEISESADAENINQALNKLLDDAGIEWHASSSKAERFFSSLEEVRHGSTS